MKRFALILTACALWLVSGCTTPPPYAPEPLPPPSAQDGTCMLEVKPRTLAGAIAGKDVAEIVGLDRHPMGFYAVQNPGVFVVPAGSREIVFRWNRGRNYAQATADCQLPRGTHLILHAQEEGKYVVFWLEDQATGAMVDQKHVGAVRYGVYIPLPVFLP